LTLEEDVAHKLRQAARRSGRSFKEVVNEALRVGLQVQSAPGPDRQFVVEAHDMGLREGLSLDNIADLLEDAEGPSHR
jgi:hypothetical protein